MDKFSLISSIFLLILVIFPSVSATTIQGTIYDMDLEPAKDSIIKVNTTPIQQIVSKDGTYSFELPLGSYKLEAIYDESKTSNLKASQNIKVIGEGTYIVDLILFPDLSEEEELLNPDIDQEELSYDDNKLPYLIFIILIILVAIVIISLILKTRKKVLNLDDDLTEKVLQKIKEEGGRTTQKELRKHFPFSEAKISLVLTELKHKGKIEKIKKGKGNIIILK